MSTFKPFQTPRFILVFFLVQPILLLLLIPSTSSTLGNEFLFLQCLDLLSDPKYPTSQLTYSQQNSSFPSMLEAYARNLRFLQPKTKKPSFIITPKHVSSIIATIKCCKTHLFELRVRGGGHDMEGLSFTSSVPFVILDMFNLRTVDVNVEEETAWVEAGAQLGEVYYKIAEKSPVHAFPGGVCPTVGVTGHFTGGGYGNLMRKYGLSSDNIIDAIVVDANGRVLDRITMGDDLFWALRGGGAASFGVVLAFKIKLVRVPPTVSVFQVARSLEEGASEAVYRWQEVAPYLPKELFLRARMSLIKDPKEEQNKLEITFIAMFLGESKELVQLLAKSLPREGLEVLWKELLEMDGLVMEWNPYGGIMAEIPSDEIAYSHRAGHLFKIEYDFKWHEETEEAEQHHVELSRRLYEFMAPYVSNSPREAFFNYRDLDIGTNPGRFSKTNAEFGEKYHGTNFPRLMKVKFRVDPLNFFRNEQSIPLYFEVI